MARAKSDLNLRALHVDAGKKRSRKPRKKPDPPTNLKEGEADAIEFLEGLPLAPGLITEEVGGRWQPQSPHSDEGLWQVQLAQAFGTRSTSLLQVFVRQLSKLCPKDWDADRQDWKVNETEWNGLIALVADWSPENSAQACLAAQMAATHLLTMRLTAQALNGGHMVMGQDAALASKLARTFAMQCETMQALKGKSRVARQSIHVTKEETINYYDHRGSDENGDQPQEPRAASTPRSAALPSQMQIDGSAVPSASREGQEGLSQARRGKGSGSAKG